MRFLAGRVMRPARCRCSMKPRHTMSHNCPLGGTQFQASHNFFDRLRRLSPGFSAMSFLMNSIRSAVATPWLPQKLYLGSIGEVFLFVAISLSVYYFLTFSLSECFKPHSCIASRIVLRLSPNGVREYSTLGGTCG